MESMLLISDKKLQEENTFGACLANQTGKSNVCNCMSD